MSLESGTALGPYQVTARLGEGGMGEVYRARDTKLDRDVALKVLPQAFTDDPDRLARFEREAKVLASLNHPNIGHIYGLEEAEGQKALVLELVEGPTLADRISHGPIPVDEALPIAKQIAEALEAAHEQGVIHRDLKPANIKVREDGTVKVLDFGLAKALDTTPEGDPSQSPTLTAAATQMGVIMGTAAYMSPEQARGKPVDKRSDIWAFGCVLYEMLTGERAFQGDDASLTLAAAILSNDVDWEKLPSQAPEHLRRLIGRCLEREAVRRLRDIGEARITLSDTSSTMRTAAPTDTASATALWHRQVRLAWIVPGSMLLAAAWLVVVPFFADSSPSRAEDRRFAGFPARFQVTLPAGVHLPVDTAIPVLTMSPDGSRLVFVGEQDGVRRLYMKVWADLESRLIPGTEDAGGPFFSSDGEWLAFFRGFGFMLERVPVAGGVPVPFHEATPVGVTRGATWVGESVVFAPSPNNGLWLGSAFGATVGCSGNGTCSSHLLRSRPRPRLPLRTSRPCCSRKSRSQGIRRLPRSRSRQETCAWS